MKQRTTNGLLSGSQKQRSLQKIKFGGAGWSAVPRLTGRQDLLKCGENGGRGLLPDVEAVRAGQAACKRLHAIGEKFGGGNAARRIRSIIARAIAIPVVAARFATIASRGELEFLHAKTQRGSRHWQHKSNSKQQEKGFEPRQHCGNLSLSRQLRKQKLACGPFPRATYEQPFRLLRVFIPA